ncbi:MAG TPA: hypothetical protein VKH43_04025 [Thermoanaerobaculia bacterium]|nr:hypothetical protein [Thermoanaerobaculia bacterium]
MVSEEPAKPSTLKAALLNQYQAIVLAGALGFTAVAGAAWPLLVLAGLECLVLPFLVGNPRFERMLLARRLASLSPGEPADPARLDAEGKRRFQHLEELTRAIEANYARLSEASQPFLEEQKTKTAAILQNALQHLRALQAYSDLDRTVGAEGDLRAEIERLEAKTRDPATAPSVRERYEQNLEFKRRLAETVARSRDLKESLSAELDSIETALRILAQESAALLAPDAAAARLDEVVREAETTGSTVREFEQIAREAGLAAGGARRARAGS